MGPILLFSAAALWGLIGPWSKLIFAGGMLPLETAFYSGYLASPFLREVLSTRSATAAPRLRQFFFTVLPSG